MDAIARPRIVVDDEFKRLLWPLSPVEFSFLEKSVIEDGCRERLVVWAGKNILVDGHNRYEICTRNDIEFDVEELEFSNREDVADWIDKNQAARRNCDPDQYKIITGRIYNRRKKTHGGDRKSKDQVDTLIDSTAEEVASELGTSAPTIKRNGQRAEVHDTMLAAGDVEAAEAAREVPQSVIVEAKKDPEKAPEILKKHHITKSTGENEWYTPKEFVDAARKVMGSIDLDPASCKLAQATVKAKKFYSIDDDGLTQSWSGNVWMNPPYSKGMVSRFASKLEESLSDIKQAVVLVNNATETEWFQCFASLCSGMCLPSSRIQFIDKHGVQNNSPMQGQAFFYFGDNVGKFVSVFNKFGQCFERSVQ